MKKKFIKIVFFILLVGITVVHSYYLTHLYSHDEIWIYGFGANILDGLVPYRDFNMVVGPVFPYLLSIILRIFGKNLLVYHVTIGVMVVFITYLASKKIKFYSLLIYMSLLIYSINGYNTSTLLWLFILLAVLEMEDRHQDILIPIIVSMMILTKQTLILLVIPNIIYSKNKKKTIAIYLVMFLSFLVYLISHNNLFQFLDYCVLGMFSFAKENSLTLPIYVFIEILIIGGLVVSLIRSKGKRKDIFYVLMYQVMVLPIFDIYHFVLGWSATLYVIFQSQKINVVVKNSLFIVLIIIETCLVFTTNSMFTIRDINLFEHYPEETFMKGRMVPKITKNYLGEMENFIYKYPDRELYILGIYSYLVKLSLDIPINKFDLINNGNMGYHGDSRYIEEIDESCSEEKCLFIVNESELNSNYYNQTNMDILIYVTTKYTKIYSSSVFGIYVN